LTYAYHRFVGIAWDKRKTALNLKKHGVEFSHAATVLDDASALTVEDTRHDELRYVTVGADLIGRIFTVVYSYPETGGIRLIPARKAT